MSKIVIGIDQSHKRTGITVLYEKKIVYMQSVNYEHLKTNNEKRMFTEHVLRGIILNLKEDGVIEQMFKKETPQKIEIITERIRLRSENFISENYIKATGALVASIIRVAEEFDIPVYSVDTKSWKNNIVGSSKPLNNPYGIDPKKYRTILYMRDKGLLKYIAEEYKGRGKKGVINVKIGGEKVPCEINDDLADSYCIALYGYLPKTKQKLKEETF